MTTSGYEKKAARTVQAALGLTYRTALHKLQAYRDQHPSLNWTLAGEQLIAQERP